MSKLQHIFVFFILLKAVILSQLSTTERINNKFRFIDNKSKELKIAERPYTVFNFATEAESTINLIEDVLQKKEQKAMRRFKVDLDDKKDRSEKMFQKILSSSLFFFDSD